MVETRKVGVSEKWSCEVGVEPGVCENRGGGGGGRGGFPFGGFLKKGGCGGVIRGEGERGGGGEVEWMVSLCERFEESRRALELV